MERIEPYLWLFMSLRELVMGKIEKGVSCSVSGCGNSAVRSIASGKVVAAGLKVGGERRAYLCKNHYKEFKKATKKERTLEKLRYRGQL